MLRDMVRDLYVFQAEYADVQYEVNVVRENMYERLAELNDALGRMPDDRRSVGSRNDAGGRSPYASSMLQARLKRRLTRLLDALDVLEEGATSDKEEEKEGDDVDEDAFSPPQVAEAIPDDEPNNKIVHGP
jgi:hypothetical protein